MRTTTKLPRVSVLTPIYNTNPAHLRAMIESILNQTFDDFEFLILNDSPENTEIEKIVKSYRDKRIKYSKNDKNMGITPSRNKLLKMARGEYVAIFDHDDISVPNRLARQVAYLDANPGVGVVSGWMRRFGIYNDIKKNPENDIDIKIMLARDCFIAHTAAMIRKSVLIDNGIEYEEYYSPCEDYQLWARLMDVTHFYNIQDVLVEYRCIPENTTNRQNTKMELMGDNIRKTIADKHPVLHKIAVHNDMGTKFRLRLFGFIPLVKIKRNTVYLFEFIPLFKIKWR